MKIFSLLVSFFICLTLTSAAQELNLPYEKIGEVSPRHAKEIESSNWSIGAETMDRDYTIYDHWKEYLGPLGFKKARIQSGWNKTERKKGEYSWKWLDEIIYDMPTRGVEPWVTLCYGNSLYADGGGTRLGAAMPKTDEAITAWLNYVQANVERYQDHVDEWEIWNEPNHGGNDAKAYANFALKTAKTIREIQPNAVIIIGALAGVDVDYTKEMLSVFEEQNALNLVNQITYHPYNKNPDDSYPRVQELRKVVNQFAPHLEIRQGENGAPSEFRTTKALSNYNWTELSQAKWALRRLLGDHGRDIESSYFAIMDMKYPDEMNRKGILYANEDKTVGHKKQAYYALQNLAAIFDSKLERVPDVVYDSNMKDELSLFVYKNNENKPLVTLWLNGEIPSDSLETVPIELEISSVDFDNPVYVDLRTGNVYQIDKNVWQESETNVDFQQLPVYDSPIVIAELETIPIED